MAVKMNALDAPLDIELGGDGTLVSKKYFNYVGYFSVTSTLVEGGWRRCLKVGG